jgi:uncharacterized protein (DUF697 family)
MFDKVKHLFSPSESDAELRDELDKLRQRAPVPVFWLFGKTQSGKTSIVKFLTGAEDAEIGRGFQPCTRFSRQYKFPTSETPLLMFLDTRGMDEPSYEPEEDLARFNDLAHLVLVTVKGLDHGQENVIRHLRVIRKAQPARPVILVLTCLHEAYPQQQHPQPYPFAAGLETPAANENLRRSLIEHRRRFEGLVDEVVPVDLTQPAEGFTDPHYGGDPLKHALLESLPNAYRQTLLTLDRTTGELQDIYARRALPHIVGYSTLAATAGAIPIPWADMVVLPGIQTRMIYHLAQLYGQPLTGQRFLELASTLGLGMAVRQAVREVVKFIPFVGSMAGAALAGASTFALGKAFCYYYRAVHQGHVPQTEELRRYYQEQLAQAERLWRTR